MSSMMRLYRFLLEILLLILHIPSFKLFYLVLSCLAWIWRSFTDFYLVLPSFLVVFFYRVMLATGLGPLVCVFLVGTNIFAAFSQTERVWNATLPCRQVMRNLHVVFTMNPSSEGLKDRASTSPALFNRCVLNWFGDWSDSALFQVPFCSSFPVSQWRLSMICVDGRWAKSLRTRSTWSGSRGWRRTCFRRRSRRCSSRRRTATPSSTRPSTSTRRCTTRRRG